MLAATGIFASLSCAPLFIVSSTLLTPFFPVPFSCPVPLHCVACVCVHCGYCVRVSCSRASLFRCFCSCLVPVLVCWSRFRVSRLPSRRVLFMRRSTAPSLGSVRHVSYCCMVMFGSWPCGGTNGVPVLYLLSRHLWRLCFLSTPLL